MINELFSSMHEQLDFMIKHYKDANSNQQDEYCECIQQLMDTSDKIMDQYISFEEKLAMFFDMYRELKQEPKQDVQQQYNNNATDQASFNVEGFESKGLYRHQPTLNDANTDTKKAAILSEKIIQATSVSYSNKSHVTICNECDLFVSEDHEMSLDQAQGYYKLLMFEKSAGILLTIITEEPACNIARLYYGMSLMHLRNWSEAQRQFQLLTVMSDYPKWLSLCYNALGCIHAIKMDIVQAELLFKRAHVLNPAFEDPLKNLQSCSGAPSQLSLYFGSTELCCM